ncbi:phosphocholine cytidylyltransferase family protein [Fodinisporobacter ferrooxydans]|uniref:Phosphocholine cytidylyltransferase family protein n=1 Tax=Fodinisporobacter ferrooxydans TaxID=2901836 RepID=A0ABY4CEM6_9BACL|nr:phosphocholine cytidylyltransferase family protein [Alicyclobacillaceae bacterium MYW30-H2]
MKAIVLAAGRGSRLKHLTDTQPKCLVAIQGKPLLHWQTQSLLAAGIENIAVVRGYRKEQIDFPGFIYFDNERWAETNMVRSMLCADSWLASNECIISYSDLIYPPEVVETLKRLNGDIGITYDPNWLNLWNERFADPLMDAETFDINDNGELMEIGRRVFHVSKIKGQYMGLLKFTPEGWSEIKNYLCRLESYVIDHLDMTSLLSCLIEAGITVQTVSIKNDWWYEIDTIHDFELANANMK